MQYYLDTNILVFLCLYPDSLDYRVAEIVTDDSNRLLTSSVCVMEAIQVMIKTNETRRKKIPDNFIFESLSRLNIQMVSVGIKHLKEFAEMPVLHSDPNDRLIIAQAASDRITLISSDLQFPLYATKMRNFNFILNRR